MTNAGLVEWQTRDAQTVVRGDPGVGSSPTAGTARAKARSRYPRPVHLHLEHRIDAPLEIVEAASNDPRFAERLNSLPNVAERTVTSREDRPDGSIDRVVRYRFSGPVPTPVAKAIGDVISWDEVGRFDPERHEWRFEIRPHVLEDRITCHGRYAFESDEDATLRTVDVDVKVGVPLVGRRVEKIIADSLRANMNAEADLLATYVQAT